MQLALGTVQFGLVYGLSGGTRLLPDNDIRELFEIAYKRGITILDTAPVYGDIESRLGSLCNGLDFKIVSKIPPIPDDLDDMRACRWALESAESSQKRLGRKLHGLLFHRAEDLLGERGDLLWSALSGWASRQQVLLGASGYDVAMVRTLFETRRMSMAQLPGNALDQRIATGLTGLVPKPEVHLRSAFLQGLLLLPIESAMKVAPAAGAALQRWHRWVNDRGVTPLQAALSVVKSFKDVSVCVAGIDNVGQLTGLVNAWTAAPSISAIELACSDLASIDPRSWGNR